MLFQRQKELVGFRRFNNTRISSFLPPTTKHRYRPLARMASVQEQSFIHQNLHVRTAQMELHMELGMESPIQGNNFVWATWRGIKRFQGQIAAETGNKPAKREPITAGVLALIQTQLDLNKLYDATIWAAFTMGTFALLRLGEFTVPDTYGRRAQPEEFEAIVLRWRHIEWYDELGNRTVMRGGRFQKLPREYRLLLPASKTDPFRQSVTIRVFAPMAVQALSNLAELRGANIKFNDPLFMDPAANNGPFSREQLLGALGTALENCGLNPDDYNGHSFRRGGAQTLAEAGISEDVIQIMGRWLSDAYKVYINTPYEVIKAASLAMEPEPKC